MSNNVSNHPSLNPRLAMNFIEAMTVTPQSQGMQPIPVMIWGQPGIGKSAIIQQIGKKHGRAVIDVRLLLKDPTDISGLPYYNPKVDKLVYSTPADFPDLNDPEQEHLHDAIIIFDELSSAPKAVQSAALQLILDRKIGQYTLPEKVIMVAAGNRDGDGNSFEEMPTPLRNRFAHIDVIADFTQWKKWAEDNNIHPIVLGYLESNGNDFNKFDPRKLSGVYAFATPRSWERVSDALWSITDRATLAIKKSMLINMAGSLVGTDVANSLSAYYETFGQVPLPVDILEGRVTQFDYNTLDNRKQQSARYATVLGLTHVLKERWNAVKGDKKAEQAYLDTELEHFVSYMQKSMQSDKEFMAIAGERVMQARIPAHKSEGFRPFVQSLHNVLNDI